MTDLAVPMEQTPDEAADYGARQQKARRTLTYLILFAIVMFFAGLTSAYVVSMSSGYWVDIRVPNAFYLSTVVILASSAVVQLALVSTRRGNTSRVPLLLAITLALGLVFAWSQFQGWSQLVERGNFVVSKVLQSSGTYGTDYTITRNGVPLVLEEGEFFLPDDVERRKPLNAELNEQQNTASSYFYVLTAAHLAHLVFGLLALALLLFRATKGRYTAASHTGLWQGTLYWHFLGGLWVYLLLFLVIIH